MNRANENRMWTLIIQFEIPFPQWLPGMYISESMIRVWWLWFGVSWLKVPFREFAETAYTWEYGMETKCS